MNIKEILKGIIIGIAKITYQCKKHPYHSQYNGRKSKEQQHTEHVVAPDLGIHSYIFHNQKLISGALS